jgi:hypothetical protein
MLKIRKILVSSMLLAWSMAPMLGAENSARFNVSYDRQTGLLTVEADRTPLTQILAQIATQSGVEIMVDPSIEKEISISLPEQPLEKALRKIARGLSYAMYYDVGDSKLVAMKILPQGKQGSGNLVPASLFDARAGRVSDQGDGSYETGGSRGGRNYPAGDYFESNRKSEPPVVNRQKTLSTEEMAAQGIFVLPPHPQKTSPIQRSNNTANETQSVIDDREGGYTPDYAPADQ